jgi:hypothetical protein
MAVYKGLILFRIHHLTKEDTGRGINYKGQRLNILQTLFELLVSKVFLFFSATF